MSLRRRLAEVVSPEVRCGRKGHDWFPAGLGPREFIPVEEICLRCGFRHTFLPYGRCLHDHPLAEHYNENGELVQCVGCGWPA